MSNLSEETRQVMRGRQGWVGILNFIILQWFCIRLMEVVDLDSGKVYAYYIFGYVVPLTMWSLKAKQFTVFLKMPRRSYEFSGKRVWRLCNWIIRKPIWMDHEYALERERKLNELDG